MDHAKRKSTINSDESSDSDHNEWKALKSKKSKKKSKSESKDRERSRSRSVKHKSSSKKSEKAKHKKDKKSKSKAKKKQKSRSRSKRKSRNSARSRSKSSDSDSLSTCSTSSSVVSFKSANDSLSKQKSPSPDSTKEDDRAARNSFISLIDADSEGDHAGSGKLKSSNGDDSNHNRNADLDVDENGGTIDEEAAVKCGGEMVEVVEVAEEAEEVALIVTAAVTDTLAHIDTVSQNKLMDEIEQAFLNESEKIANLADLDLDIELGLHKSPSSECKVDDCPSSADVDADAYTEVFEANNKNGFESPEHAQEQQEGVAANEPDNTERVDKIDQIDQISIMVQTEYHIDPNEVVISNKNKKVMLDKAIYCNTDPLYCEKNDKLLTMVEIEKLISVVDDKITDLNSKKKHLISLKQDKLLKKKKIQNAVNNKSSIEFGLFDNCLTLTKKGTLRIEQASESKNDNKSNPVTTATILVENDPKEISTEKEKPETHSKKNGPEKTVKQQRNRKKRVRAQLELFSSDSEADKKVAPKVSAEPEIPQKKRRLFLDKYSKKSTSKKNYKSSELVMEDSSESDEKTSVNTREKRVKSQQQQHKQKYQSHDKKYQPFFEQKCFVRIYTYDLKQMREDLVKKTKQEKHNKIIEISNDSIANEEVIEDVDMNEDFEVVMVSDRSSTSEDEDNLENNNHNSLDRSNKSDEAVDILKLLDKKHEVITEFIT